LYAIITAHKTFEKLGTFTLSYGLREIHRVQQIKEEQALQAERNRKDDPSRERASVESAHQEKARLLRNESDSALIAQDIESLALSSEEHDDGGQEHAETRPLTSPPSENTPTSSTTPTTPVSEKARGKMKARRSSSLDTGCGDITAAGVGRNGFLPTQDWVSSLS